MLILNKKICEITEEDAKWFVEKFASKEIELLKKVTHVPFSCDLLNGEKDPHELIVEDGYCKDSIIDFKLQFKPLEKRTIGHEIGKDICFYPYINNDPNNNKCSTVIVKLGRMHCTENGHEEDGFNVYLHIHNTKQKEIMFFGSMIKIDVPLYNTRKYVEMVAEYALQLDGTYANLATGHVIGMQQQYNSFKSSFCHLVTDGGFFLRSRGNLAV